MEHYIFVMVECINKGLHERASIPTFSLAHAKKTIKDIFDNNYFDNYAGWSVILSEPLIGDIILELEEETEQSKITL